MELIEFGLGDHEGVDDDVEEGLVDLGEEEEGGDEEGGGQVEGAHEEEAEGLEEAVQEDVGAAAGGEEGEVV